MSHPVLDKTYELGQSLWLDFISRQLLSSGELKKLIADGVRGLTSNPTIFEKAISSTDDYDREIEEGIAKRWKPEQIFESLAIADIQEACDNLHSVYEKSDGGDGFVSFEVSPKLAYDTAGTVENARRLWRKVKRPNLMIKVPGTREGVPAVRTLLREGINVNVTLLFSIAQYRSVLSTYMLALEDRLKRDRKIPRTSSVASFFVSRLDGVVDRKLAHKPELLGKTAVANACRVYSHFLEVTKTERWQRLANAGAKVQRPLWASTSTKNPAYSDILYVQELIAKDTVNTLPPQTLDAFKDHGKPDLTLMQNLKETERVLSEVEESGIDLRQVTADLIVDGVKKFENSFDQVLAAIQKKMNK